MWPLSVGGRRRSLLLPAVVAVLFGVVRARISASPLLNNVDDDRPQLGSTLGNVASKAVVLTINVLRNGRLIVSQSASETSNSSAVSAAAREARLRKLRARGDKMRAKAAGGGGRLHSTIASSAGNVATRGLFVTVNLLLGGAGQGAPVGPVNWRGRHQEQCEGGQSSAEARVETVVASTYRNTAEMGAFVTLNYFAGEQCGELTHNVTTGEEELVLRLRPSQLSVLTPLLSQLLDKLDLSEL